MNYMVTHKLLIVWVSIIYFYLFRKMFRNIDRNVVIKTSRSQSPLGSVLFFYLLSREPLVPPRWCSCIEIV